MRVSHVSPTQHHRCLEFPLHCLPRIFLYHTALPITCFPRPQVESHQKTHPHTPLFHWTWAVQIPCWIVMVSVSWVSSILCREFPAACRVHFPPFSQNLEFSMSQYCAFSLSSKFIRCVMYDVVAVVSLRNIFLELCQVASICCMCNSSVAIFRLLFLFLSTLQCLQQFLQLFICGAFSDPLVQTANSFRELLLISACLVFVPTFLP